MTLFRNSEKKNLFLISSVFTLLDPNRDIWQKISEKHHCLSLVYHLKNIPDTVKMRKYGLYVKKKEAKQQKQKEKER